jgi:hypothetical protein
MGNWKQREENSSQILYINKKIAKRQNKLTLRRFRNKRT